MNMLGFTDYEDKQLRIDDLYGPRTASAVRKFQEKNGLKVDGIFGPKTAAKFNEMLSDKYLLISPGEAKNIGAFRDKNREYKTASKDFYEKTRVVGEGKQATTTPPTTTTSKGFATRSIGADGRKYRESIDPPSENLPRVDKPTKYSGGPQPGSTELKMYIQKQIGGGDGGIYNPRSVRGDPTGRLSLHAEGRAYDAEFNARVPEEKSKGDALFHWSIKNAANIGVQEVIWNGRIWTPKKGLQLYRGQNSHTDHVHIGLNNDGAQARTPFFKDNKPEELSKFWASRYAP